MKFWQRHRNQSGDTIIEVLIVIAIISLVIAGAFLVTQRSTVAVRDSQEHSEALQLLQGQVEQLRSLTQQQPDTMGGIYATSPQWFCIDNNSANPTYQKRVDSPSITGIDDLTDYTKYAAACKSLNTFYNVAATYDTSTTPGVFKLYATWDRLKGGTDRVELVYRVYPGQVSLAWPPGVAGGSGPSGSPTGNAGVSPAPCSLSAITGLCIPEVAGYHWDRFVQNTSSNPTTTVLGCTWTWTYMGVPQTGPGQIDTDKFCNTGDVIWHYFPPYSGFPTYPTGCVAPYQRTESVTLKLQLANGTTPSKTYPLVVPRCTY